MELVTNLAPNTDLYTDQLTCPAGSTMTGSGTKLLGKPTTQLVETEIMKNQIVLYISIQNHGMAYHIKPY